MEPVSCVENIKLLGNPTRQVDALVSLPHVPIAVLPIARWHLCWRQR